jgi:hypothetical protein
MDTKALIEQVKFDAYELLLEISKRTKQNESNNRVSISGSHWGNSVLREIVIRHPA